MKCNMCNKRLLIPFYNVKVVDENGNEVEHFYVCRKCFKVYQYLAKMEQELGLEKTLEVIGEMQHAANKEDSD